jgi:hypothetical protein
MGSGSIRSPAACRRQETVAMPSRLPALALCLGLVATVPAAAQSDAASEVSAVSVAPSVELASVALQALPAGSELVVESVQVVGESVLVTVASAAEGASFVLELGAKAASGVVLAAGTVVSVAVVAGGYVLSVAGEVLAFIPDAAALALMHHEALD